jgi:hypothetical protein
MSSARPESAEADPGREHARLRRGTPLKGAAFAAAGASDPRLTRAKARLDRLDWWPRPVRIGHVRIVVTPWLFRLRPWRRFDGFATHFLVFLRRADLSDDLVTHELCHVWQMQHRPLRMPLSYLRTGYRRNPYERQAREAARWTADPPDMARTAAET